MAIKSMAAKVRTCAELIHGENREHLARANVDEIIVRGESAGALLATGDTNQAAREVETVRMPGTGPILLDHEWDLVTLARVRMARFSPDGFD
jgi:hypothetical protein